MGSMPRLKIKNEANYRQGSTNDAFNCKTCGNRVHMNIRGTKELRCKIFGVRDSIRYRIRADYRCDYQDYTKEAHEND